MGSEMCIRDRLLRRVQEENETGKEKAVDCAEGDCERRLVLYRYVFVA